MSTLDVRDLSVEAGGLTVVERLSFSLRAGDKVGVVGRNGAGKTSTLKVLAREDLPACGTIEVRGALGYLRQDPRQHRDDDDASGLEYILSARDLVEMSQRLEKVRIQLEEDPSERNVRRFARLEDEYRRTGGYRAESEARTITAGLGLAQDRLSLPVGALSGGERRRLELARILFGGSDLLLLDEPTNHLDVDAKTLADEVPRRLQGRPDGGESRPRRCSTPRSPGSCTWTATGSWSTAARTRSTERHAGATRSG